MPFTTPSQANGNGNGAEGTANGHMNGSSESGATETQSTVDLSQEHAKVQHFIG